MCNGCGAWNGVELNLRFASVKGGSRKRVTGSAGSKGYQLDVIPLSGG